MLAPTVDDNAPLSDRLRELEDREKIGETFSRFAFAMDVQDWDLLGDVFTADAVVDHRHATFSGVVSDIWTGHGEVMAKMRQGISRHVASQHLITNHLVRFEGDRA